MEQLNPEVLVHVLQTATRDVFATMLGTEVVCGEPHQETVPPNPTEGVVSLIGLAGNWVGTGAVACSAPLACKLSSLMLMSQAESVNEEVLDVVAELTNMIIGNVKTGLEETLGPMGLSVPTVVFGKNFTTRSIADGQWTVCPFEVEGGTLEVKICLTPNRRPVLQARPGFPHTYSLQG
ncbi:MAG TPA: chemotaxis protein CheX [Bryobacteraceae bacterium]|nr:chemotaxis protein CheX [Bryobacteraceae bacterium]